ncbi:MAG: hypothetical protein IIY49_05540 [Eubacterium sp.]|nr:hypothetical protein [Eubacterium sp.]
MGKNKWKGKSKRKNGESGENKLPIGVTLLLILLGSVAFVMFCVGTGFMIDAIVAFSTGDVESGKVAKYMWRIVPVGIIHIFFFIAFCLDGIPGLKKSKEESYREDIWGIFLIVMAFSAVVLMALAGRNGREMDGIIGFLTLPAIGVLVTPKMVKSALNKMKKWESSSVGLSFAKDEKNIYKVKEPVSFERRLFWEVFKYQMKMALGAILIITVLIIIAIHRITHKPHWIGRHAYRGPFYSFSLIVGVCIFAIPAVIVFLTKTIYKLSIVKRQKYKAYHVTAKRVNDKAVIVEFGNRVKSFKYPVCVGIRKKKINDTKATLILLPDLVMIFPD